MAVNVTAYPTYAHARKADFAGKTAVVIDVLRATSTIASVLRRGCRAVIPVEKIEDGPAMKERLGGQECAVCGGERDGVKLEGYDYGNSPLEYRAEDIAGKYVVLCTTNGTQAIAKASRAAFLLTGCFNNAAAVAQAIAGRGLDVALLCSGTRQTFSADDVLAAGAVIDRLEGMTELGTMDDLSCTALALYRAHRDGLKEFLSFSRPYKTLERLNAMHDIDFCFTEDNLTSVPLFENGRITDLAETPEKSY